MSAAAGDALWRCRSSGEFYEQELLLCKCQLVCGAGPCAAELPGEDGGSAGGLQGGREGVLCPLQAGIVRAGCALMPAQNLWDELTLELLPAFSGGARLGSPWFSCWSCPSLLPALPSALCPPPCGCAEQEGLCSQRLGLAEPQFS